ncbi:uncharacterized protein LOC123383019 [Felis catus]|uniref:uncharacterized protein LOC123383019 n=1 Tax=Felis catus TaxID=9685 RepID=UPI001D1A05EB|nr:uncharacterized protein LOC123383019 [Felis catus]
MDHKALVPEGRRKATVSPRAGRRRALSPARLAARAGRSRRSGLCSSCASASASAGGRREPPRGTASWKAPASRRLRSSGSRHGGDGGLLLAVRALTAPGGAARRARASGPKPNTDWDSVGSPGSRFSAAAGVPGAHSRGGGAHSSGSRRRWFPVTPRRGCNWITSCSLECLRGRLVSLQIIYFNKNFRITPKKKVLNEENIGQRSNIHVKTVCVCLFDDYFVKYLLGEQVVGMGT